MDSYNCANFGVENLIVREISLENFIGQKNHFLLTLGIMDKLLKCFYQMK